MAERVRRARRRATSRSRSSADDLDGLRADSRSRAGAAWRSRPASTATTRAYFRAHARRRRRRHPAGRRDARVRHHRLLAGRCAVQRRARCRCRRTARPSIHAHAGAAATRLVHLEYFRDHARMEAVLFDGALRGRRRRARVRPEAARPRPRAARDRRRAAMPPDRALVPLRHDRGDHARQPARAARCDREVDGDVRFDRGTRALYATDASNYRHVPIGVVIPRTIDALIATVARVPRARRADRRARRRHEPRRPDLQRGRS